MPELGRLALILALILGASPAAYAQAVIYLPVPKYVGPPAPMVGNYGNIRSVAVVSLIGNELNLRNLHSIFGRAEKLLDIRDWKIDDIASKELAQLLASKFEVKSIPTEVLSTIDPKVFGREKREKPTDSSALYRRTFASLPGDVDAFVVLRYIPTDITVPIHFQTPFAGASPEMQAFAVIEIVDAKTFEVLGSSLLRIQREGEKSATFAAVKLDSQYRLNDDFKISDEQMTMYRKALTALVTLAIPETLRSLQLGLKLPPRPS